MRVFVAGGTGAIGRFLVPELLRAGHEAVVLTRSEERAAAVRAEGVEPVVGDALDRESVVAAVREGRPDVVVDQLTAIPADLDPRDVDSQFAPTNRLRTEGTRNLLDAADGAHVIAQSVAFAYEPEGDWIKDEDAPLYSNPPKGFAETAAALKEHERLVLDAGGTVLRYGQFYGPGTAYAEDGALGELVRKRRFPVVGNGEARLSFIHVADAARATVAALESGTRGVFNIVDDEPLVSREWLREFADLVGAKPPRSVPAWIAKLAAGEYGVAAMTTARGASNRRAREKLGWAPRYPAFRDGFRAEAS